MAHTTLLPYSGTHRTPRRRHWRRYSPALTSKTPPTPPVHTSPLPDLVHDCQMQLQRRQQTPAETDDQTKFTCKQIAHSLRIVADRVDEKFCQVSAKSIIPLIRYLCSSFISFQDITFRQHLHYLSIRFIFQTAHLRTIFYTLWTRSFVPLVLMICKTKPFLFAWTNSNDASSGLSMF